MGLIEIVKKRWEPTIVEMDVKLEDGKPIQVKCRPLVAMDYLSIAIEGFNTVPIITGRKADEDLDPEEQVNAYRWMRELTKKAIYQISSTDEGGKRVWLDVEWLTDEVEAPESDGKKIKISLKHLEALAEGMVGRVAKAVIERSNFGLEAPKRVQH